MGRFFSWIFANRKARLQYQGYFYKISQIGEANTNLPTRQWTASIQFAGAVIYVQTPFEFRNSLGTVPPRNLLIEFKLSLLQSSRIRNFIEVLSQSKIQSQTCLGFIEELLPGPCFLNMSTIRPLHNSLVRLIQCEKPGNLSLLLIWLTHRFNGIKMHISSHRQAEHGNNDQCQNYRCSTACRIGRASHTGPVRWRHPSEPRHRLCQIFRALL